MFKKITLVFILFLLPVQLCFAKKITSISQIPEICMSLDDFTNKLDEIFPLFVTDWKSLDAETKTAIKENFKKQKSWRIFIWLQFPNNPRLAVNGIMLEVADFLKNPEHHGMDRTFSLLIEPILIKTSTNKSDRRDTMYSTPLEPERIKFLLERVFLHPDFVKLERESFASSELCNAIFDLLFPEMIESEETRTAMLPTLSDFLNYDKTCTIIMRSENGVLKDSSKSKTFRQIISVASWSLYGWNKLVRMGPESYGRTNSQTNQEFAITFHLLQPLLLNLFYADLKRIG